MKKLLFLITLVLFLFTDMHASQIDIGEDINFEYRYLRRVSEVIAAEFRQRIKFYLIGHLEDDIEMGARLQSSGVMNSTSSHIIYQGAKIDNLTPFFEHAYIKINRYYGYPVSITIGKIPLKWADGILVNDNQLGIPAILIEGDVPFDIKAEAFHCRTRDDLLDISGIKGYGLRSIRRFGFRRVELDLTIENYRSSAVVNRTIYGGNFMRELKRGLEYKLYYYKMKGKKGDEKFSGYSMGAYGRFEGVVDPIGKGGAWIRYDLGTGHPSDDEKGFLPILSSIESDMIGDYYGRFREHRYKDGVLDIDTLSHTIANLSSFRQSVYATVRDDVGIFIIRSTYKRHQPNVPVGGAFTMGGIYKYRFITCEIRYTAFTPEPAYDLYGSDRPSKIYTASINAEF